MADDRGFTVRREREPTESERATVRESAAGRLGWECVRIHLQRHPDGRQEVVSTLRRQGTQDAPGTIPDPGQANHEEKQKTLPWLS